MATVWSLAGIAFRPEALNVHGLTHLHSNINAKSEGITSIVEQEVV
jgi:hypothetical protein